MERAGFEEAVRTAVDAVLRRSAPEDRPRTLDALRRQMERCLAEAPARGPEAGSASIRARLADLLATHPAR